MFAEVCNIMIWSCSRWLIIKLGDSDWKGAYKSKKDQKGIFSSSLPSPSCRYFHAQTKTTFSIIQRLPMQSNSFNTVWELQMLCCCWKTACNYIFAWSATSNWFTLTGKLAKCSESEKPGLPRSKPLGGCKGMYYIAACWGFLWSKNVTYPPTIEHKVTVTVTVYSLQVARYGNVKKLCSVIWLISQRAAWHYTHSVCHPTRAEIDPLR